MKSIIKLISDETLVKQYIEKGKGLFNDGEIEKAFRNYNKAILLNNKYSLAYFVKADAFLELYEADEAEKCIKEYLKLVPSDPNAYWKLIDINDLTGDFDKCVYYCEKLLEGDNQNALIYLKKGEFLTILNSLKEALDCFNICLKLSPDFYDAICGKASVLFSLSNKEEALKLYNRAIFLDNTKSIAYFGASEVCVVMENNESALLFAEKAYEIEPKNEWYKCHYTVLKNMYLDIK
ncbi:MULTISPECIES: tetratricopeptide repeat protein [Clostridium]|uniref:Tetratricopeptide repeat protein n=1 Tax=Clostridium frigoriphilum TaxID=443253 RepID=A0ABU7UM64_9CLOT|nr:tetratricopeptide repeat protein [Clostridium sp. DSM 17811]MBU3099614.1 hypothetical protein [Clostridium sp. DSM 17811]